MRKVKIVVKEKKPTPTEALKIEIARVQGQADYWQERFEATLEGRLVRLEDGIMDSLREIQRGVNR